MTNPYHVHNGLHIDRRRRPNLTFGRTKEYLSELSRCAALPTILASIHPLFRSAITVAIMNRRGREERRRGRSRAAKRPSVRRADNLHPIQNALFPSGSGKERELTEFLIQEIIR